MMGRVNETSPQPGSRRTFLAGALASPMLAPLASRIAQAQQPRDWTGQNPVRYPDADIVVLDKRFKKYAIGNTPVKRLYTGALWAEGPAWNAVGRYLLFSDIPNNVQMRWLEEDGHVSTFRNPSNYSNGNTFDFQGRQLSCEHQTRRVVRYEFDGTVTVIADKFQGKQFNAPNDIVVDPEGNIWFTDPGYGTMGNYEGGKATMEIKEATYRVDGKTAKVEMVSDELFKPNGICFSPNYKKLYICDTGSNVYPQAKNIIAVYDIQDGRKLRNTGKPISCDMNGKSGLADGIRADRDGNIWAGMGWVGSGYDGVHCYTAEGERIGLILLPEICANICFGGAKRNRLFMAAGQSLYSVFTEAQGAHIT
jgi:gluconolactonase